MCKTVTLEPVDDVPAGSSICHYDELAERTKVELPTLTEATDVAVDTTVADGFRSCDLVKYTEYYDVTIQ